MVVHHFFDAAPVQALRLIGHALPNSISSTMATRLP
jgi:hypothetical protein